MHNRDLLPSRGFLKRIAGIHPGEGNHGRGGDDRIDLVSEAIHPVFTGCFSKAARAACRIPHRSRETQMRSSSDELATLPLLKMLSMTDGLSFRIHLREPVLPGRWIHRRRKSPVEPTERVGKAKCDIHGAIRRVNQRSASERASRKIPQRSLGKSAFWFEVDGVKFSIGPVTGKKSILLSGWKFRASQPKQTPV